MKSKYLVWYESLSAAKQIAVSFLLNFLVWLISWLFVERILFDENRSWAYHIYHATFMSLFTTLSSRWHLFKTLFRKKKKRDGMESSP